MYLKILQSFDYKPFGDTLNAGGESRIGYAAQERDEESRYFAMGARQYDPLSGRFLSVDPLYESFPDKTPYHYCNNNPISFKDPSGLSPEEEKKSVDQIQTLVWKDISEEMEATETGGLFEDNRQFVETMNWASGGLTDEEYQFQMNPAFWFSKHFGDFSSSGGSSGTRIAPGGEEFKDEREKLVSTLSEVTHCDIECDKNGLITSAHFKGGICSPNQIWAARRFLELLKNVESSDKYFDVIFEDDSKLETDNPEATGTRVFWNSGGYLNPTLAISREKYFSGTLKPDRYIYFDHVEKGIFNYDFYDLFSHNLSSILAHEFLGHAFQYYYLGCSFRGMNKMSKETFAISAENMIHEMYGEPYRLRYESNLPTNDDPPELDIKLDKKWLKPFKR
jgi:RHS repeat-associated protein